MLLGCGWPVTHAWTNPGSRLGGVCGLSTALRGGWRALVRELQTGGLSRTNAGVRYGMGWVLACCGGERSGLPGGRGGEGLCVRVSVLLREARGLVTFLKKKIQTGLKGWKWAGHGVKMDPTSTNHAPNLDLCCSWCTQLRIIWKPLPKAEPLLAVQSHAPRRAPKLPPPLLPHR